LGPIHLGGALVNALIPQLRSDAMLQALTSCYDPGYFSQI